MDQSKKDIKKKKKWTNLKKTLKTDICFNGKLKTLN
jgi:hypothetical protein